MARHQHAECQCADVFLDAGELEYLGAAESQHQAVEHQQLPVPEAVKHPVQQRFGDQQQQQHDSPGRRQAVLRHRHEHDRREILDDQDADRDSPMQRAHFAPLFEYLHREHGARETQRERDEQRTPGVERREIRHAVERQPEYERAKSDGDDDHVQPGNGPDLRARQRRQTQFQPDREQQQGDTEVGQFLEHLAAGDALGV